MSDLTLRYKVGFHRGQRPRAVTQSAAGTAGEDAAPLQAARYLAMGHRVDQAIRDGEIGSYAEAARRFGISPPRMNQICQLALLAPAIQERLLCGELQISAAALLPIAQMPAWSDQGRALQALLDGEKTS